MLYLNSQLQYKQYTKMLFRELRRRELILSLRKPLLLTAKNIFGFNPVTVKDLKQDTHKYSPQEFGNQEIVSIGKPITINNKLAFQKYLQNFTFDKPFVCNLHNVKLIGPTAIGVNNQGSIFLETTIPQYYSMKSPVEKSLTIQALLSMQSPFQKDFPTLDVACSLVNKYGRNYWHWIVDCLTRLEGLAYYQQTTGIKPRLIINENPSVWQIESLKLLGYTPDDCVHWNGSRMQVKQLITPSFRRLIVNDHLHSFVSPQACSWVSQQILNNLPHTASNQSYSPKVFISRRKALARRITNEDEVLAALAPFGFVAYTLEDMSFTEQVRLFSQAKIVIAPHGAGLANIIFSQNLSVVELFGSFMQPCFFLLSKGLGFQYGFLQCHSSQVELRRKDGDMTVNISHLLELLERIHN